MNLLFSIILTSNIIPESAPDPYLFYMNSSPVKYKTKSGPKLRQTTNINDCQDIFYASKSGGFIYMGLCVDRSKASQGITLYKCISIFH